MGEAFDVSVIVPAFGARYARWARERAIPSAEAQVHDGRCEVIEVAGPTVVACRNAGARNASTEWLLFLDADDWIRPGYLAAMAAGTADVRGPATVFTRPGRPPTPPRCIEPRPLTDSNYLVIGTMLRRDLFLELGGFREWEAHEDHDLWMRCERAGATIEQIPDAVYVVFERPGSRNRQVPLARRRELIARMAAGEGPP